MFLTLVVIVGNLYSQSTATDLNIQKRISF